MGILAIALLTSPTHQLLALLVDETSKKITEGGSTALNGWMALGAVVAGGAVTKIIDKYFALRERKSRAEDDRRKELTSEESGFRSELRQQIVDMRGELATTRAHVGDLQTMVDEWREKYYQNIAENLDLNRKYVTLQAEHSELQEAYKEIVSRYEDLSDLQRKYDALQSRFDDLLSRVKRAGVQI